MSDEQRRGASVEELRRRLAAAEARFRNIVERTADGIVLVDPDGAILFANPAAEELFGRGAGELVGESLGSPVVPGRTTEIDLVRPDGRPAVAELRITRTQWEGAEALLVALRDVTSRKRAEENERELIREQAARREAEAAADRNEFLADAGRALSATLDPVQILETLVQLSVRRPGDVSVVDVVRAEVHVGPRRLVRAADGHDRIQDVEEFEDLDVPLLLPGAVTESMSHGTARLISPVSDGWLAQAAADDETAQRFRALGPRSLIVAPLQAGDSPVGALIVLSTRDGDGMDESDVALVQELSRRAAIALENARLFRLSRQASQAKSDFLNVISHELRTPLTGIMGYSGLLLEGIAGDLDEGQREYVEGIERSSDQLLGIIDQILLFADTEADRAEVRPVTESLGELLEDVLAIVRPLAEREELELRTELPGEDVRLRIDAEKVRQILLHLLNNAAKFTPEGWIALRVRVPDDLLVLEVADSGIGIARDKQELIFQPFTQIESSSTRQAGGTGIGLNVVKNLVQLLGGTIDVDSDPGAGSTFTVRLPARRERGDGAGNDAR